MPNVSVIMNCFNSSKFLRQAIDSVFAQSYKDWEIIFWDNASTDSSAEIAKGYDSRLRYFRGDKTVPLYAARNLALKEAKGKYIAVLDCDDLWLRQKLEWQVPLFENEKIGLVYSNVEILDDNDNARAWYVSNNQPSGKIFAQLLRHYHINLQTVMLSRMALDSLTHWFDDSLSTSGDGDLFLRIAHDWDIQYLPQITARYREHAGSTSSRYPEFFIKESEYLINKLSKLYDNFDNENRLEITAFRARVQKGFIYNKWKNGNNAEARKLALQHLLNVRAIAALYIFSFFPFPLMNYLRNLNPIRLWRKLK